MKTKTYRAWINQPSALQPLHFMHGQRCIVEDNQEPSVRAWFTDGDTHSIQAPRECMSRMFLSSAED